VNPWLVDDSWYELENRIAYGLSPIESVSLNSSGPAQRLTAGAVASTGKDGSDMSDVSGFTPDMPAHLYRDYCYICRDPEYAAMGLPLCRRCGECGGHVAADDCVCDDCGHDAAATRGERGAA
jgi:hypothetical protein